MLGVFTKATPPGCGHVGESGGLVPVLGIVLDNRKELRKRFVPIR
jgi:hypothetical protein